MAGVTHRLSMADKALETVLTRPEAGKALMGRIFQKDGSSLSDARVEVPIPGEASLALAITEKFASRQPTSDMRSDPNPLIGEG